MSIRHGLKTARRTYRPLLELLERRIVFASDFGDAPLPYPTLLAEGGAEHVAVGPILGRARDTEADGVHSPRADGDDSTGVPDDENGVTFGEVRVGQLESTAIVKVARGSAKLDAWIDFNADGAWGGPGEQIADRVFVAPGDNMIKFDVPSWAKDGTAIARFRLSTAGDLGVVGVAADGEVEDHTVVINPPVPACGCFNFQSLNGNSSGPWSVHAADVDNDGDTDVLSAGSLDKSVTWFENDGSPGFVPNIITFMSQTARSVYTADVDGDGDTDVFAASSNEIAWYENDGQQSFTPHTISYSAYGAWRVRAADIDNDGDIDALSASRYDDKIAWYENDGAQNFTAHTITTTADAARGVYAADVDSDGDMDVLSASRADNKVAWYENDGSQNFTAHAITTAGGYAVHAADMDDDGDTDVIAAGDESVAWFENDGSQNFTPHAIDSDAEGARDGYAADLDGDGDMDVLAASFRDNKIYWYQNDGSQTFIRRTISSAFGAFSVYAADVDGDGDLDALSASTKDHRIAWYENLDSASPMGHRNGIPGNLDAQADVFSASVHGSTPAAYKNRRPKPASRLTDIPRNSGNTEPQSLVGDTTPPPIIRLTAIKRLADVDWADILHDNLPLFGEW